MTGIPPPSQIPLPQTMRGDKPLLAKPEWILEPTSREIEFRLQDEARANPEGLARLLQDVAIVGSTPLTTVAKLTHETMAGVANLFGAGIQPWYPREAAVSVLRKAAGAVGIGSAGDRDLGELYRQEIGNLQSAQDKMGFLLHSANKAGEMVGFVVGTFNPATLGGMAFGGLNRLNSLILNKAISSSVPSMLPRALAMGQLEAVRAMGGDKQETMVLPDGWQPLEAGLMAAGMWPLYEVAGILGRGAAVRWLTRGGRQSEAFHNWSRQNLAVLPGESHEAFLRRGVTEWVNKGMPGAGSLSTEKLVANSIAGVVEGAGFSTLDIEWWKNGIDAIVKGDPEAALKWLSTTAGNMLGATALRVGGKITDVPRWKREQPGNDYVTEGFVLGKDVARLGWSMRPDTGRIEFGEGSPYYLEATAKGYEPSPKLRRVLGIKSEIPPEKILDLIEDSSLISLLATKNSLPGREVDIGVVAESGIERGEQGKMYQHRFGEVVERPLDPKGRWVPSKNPPVRIKDFDIPPEQRQVNEQLAELRARATQLEPRTTAILDQVIKTLRTVSANNDPAVAEAVAAFPSVMPRLLTADAHQAARDMAHLLTSKSPRVLEAEFAERQQKDAEDARKVPLSANQAKRAADALQLHGQGPVAEALHGKLSELARGGKRTTVELTGPEQKEVQRVIDLVSLYPSKETMPRVQALKDLQRAIELAEPQNLTQEEFIGKLEGVEKARAVKAHKEAVASALEAGEPVAPEVLRDYPEMAKVPTEVFGGIPQLRPLGAVLGRISEAVRTGIETVLSADIKPLVERVRAAGEPGKADQGWEVITRFKEHRGAWNFEFSEMAKALKNRQVRQELSGRVFDESGKYAWTRWHLAMDEAAGKKFGFDRSSLSEAARAVVDKGHNIFLTVGKQMEAAGAMIRVEGKDGKEELIPFRYDENRWRMVRRFTPEAREALLQKSGPIYEGMVEMIRELNGVDISSDKGKGAAVMLDRMLVGHDAAEFSRVFELMPDAIKIDGRLVEILEAHPYSQTYAMAEHGSMRAAFGSVLGWDVKVPDAGVADLPLPVAEWVAEARPEAQGPLKDMVRALSGIPVDAPLRFLKPGTAAYDAWNYWRTYMQVWRGLKMSKSALVNIPELSGAAFTFLGARRTTEAAAEALGHAVGGSAMGVIKRLADKGILTRDVLDYAVTKEGSEKAAQVGRNINQALTAPFRFVQEYMVELPMALAVESASASMQRGEGGGVGLRSMLRGMGFSKEATQQMLDGKGSAEDYKRFETSALHYLAGGSTGTRAEKSYLAQKNVWKSAIMFADYFRSRMNQLGGILRAVREAKGPQEHAEAATMLARFVAFGTVSGALAASLGRLTGGLDDVLQMYREWWEDPEEFLKVATVGSLVGGLGAVFLGALTEGDDATSVVEAAVEGFAPYSAAKELGDFITSFAPGGPSSTNPYAGMGDVEKVGAFIEQLAPLGRDISRGLFGISAIALSEEDPAISDALRVYNRWWAKNVGFDDPRSDKDAEDKEFRTAMKAVSRLLKEGKKGGPEIREALVRAVKAKGWDSVSASLSARKRLDRHDFKALDPEKRTSLLRILGDERVRILRRYDAILDVLAKWTRR